MQYISEYKNFYKEGDLVVIEYWYDDIMTKVKVLEKISKNSYKVTHNIPESKIFNAPDEIIKSNNIIDISR